jgi:di/tricarboxylate transporter
MLFNSAIWIIAVVATVGVIARPWNWPEFVWAVAGAAVLVLFNLLSWQEAVAAVGRGTDVYLFLIGMMLLSEVARKEGLFDWLATQAVSHARGSAKRLFLIIYVVGTLVTVFLSNDATAVVMTPAVYAATRAARVEPLPYLLICAFIANAASFVLPIANPANLVVFGGQMPALSEWLRHFAGPSFVAILATYIALRLTQRPALNAKVAAIKDAPPLTLGGKLAAIGIALTVVVLLSASAFDRPLGLPTFCAGASLTAIVLVIARQSPLPILKDISWSVLPLVAGLFVVVANRCVVSAGGKPARRCGGVAASDVVGRRHCRCCRLQPRQQSADGSDRGRHKPCCAGAPTGGRRDSDRRRSRAQSFRDRLARHHPVADRIAPRGREDCASSVSQIRPPRHAARANAVAACLVGDVPMKQTMFPGPSKIAF